MKPTHKILRWVGLLALASSSFFVAAAEPAIDQGPLDQAFARLRTYDWGQSREALEPINEAIRASFGDATRRRQLETRLAALLATDAPVAAKRFVCERLSLIGTAQSVPALASLLGRAETSHPARLALERIPDPPASAALRQALSQVEDPLKVGIINSLGVLKDASAVGPLTRLLASANPEVGAAAASALGQIATAEACRTLGEFRQTAPKQLEAVVNAAWLAAAERLADTGDRAEAAGVFRQLYSSGPTAPLRLAGFRGLIKAEPEKGADLISSALRSQDDPLRSLATRLLAEGAGSPALQPFIESFQTFPPRGQVALLNVFRERRETRARPAVLEVVQSPDLAARLAALRALGVIGAAADVPLLARLATPGGSEASKAALLALASLPGKDATTAIAAQLGTVSAEGRCDLIRVLVARRAVEASPAIAEHLADSNEAVRAASLEALAAIGGKEQVPALVKILTTTSDDRVRGAAERALQGIAGREGANCAEALMAGWNDAQTTSRVALLRLLGTAGGAKALETVRAALQANDAAVKEAALRVLTEWPSADAAQDLQRLAQAGENPYQSLLAFRGYVRLCRESQKPTGEKARMLAEVTTIAKTVAQKRLLIAALGDLHDRAVLPMLAPFFADPNLVEETCLATVKVGADLGPESKDEAVPTLRQVLKLSKNQEVRDQAQKAIERLATKPGQSRP